MPEPAIRAALPEDVPALAALHVATWRAAYRGILPADVLATLSEPEWRARWHRFVVHPGRTNLVAERAGEVVGFAAFGPAGEGREAELYGLYVRPEQWGTGVGGALWRAAEARLRAERWPAVLLWVFEANPRARRFYERAGFRPVAGATRALERFGARAAEVQYRLPLG